MKFIIDQGNHAGQVTYQHYQPEKVTHLLYFLGQLSRGVVILLYFCLLMMVLAWLPYGLPKKAQQDERVKDGCSKTWWIFLCSTYGFVYFSTDADGCGPVRVSMAHECNRAIQLYHKGTHGAGDSWHL